MVWGQGSGVWGGGYGDSEGPGGMFLNSSLARVTTHVLARVITHVLARALLHVLAHSSRQFELACVATHVLARVITHMLARALLHMLAQSSRQFELACVATLSSGSLMWSNKRPAMSFFICDQSYVGFIESVIEVSMQLTM